MPSDFDSFAADAAEFMGDSLGETCAVTVSGGEAVDVDGCIVLRDPLGVRPTDGGQRLEYTVAVQIPMARYPTAAGGQGGQPVVKADTVAVAVRAGDTVKTTRTVSEILGQVAGMWFLGLD